jgi:putative flippase GtrA
MRVLLGQGMRYALTGATVALVYVGSTLMLHDVAGLAFQLALALGLVIALTTHFVLQRSFVWSHDDAYALRLSDQAKRYVVIALVQYGLTALSTSLLPRALGVETTVVYVVTVGCLSALTFMLLRTRVFHPAGGPA